MCAYSLIMETNQIYGRVIVSSEQKFLEPLKILHY